MPVQVVDAIVHKAAHNRDLVPSSSLMKGQIRKEALNSVERHKIQLDAILDRSVTKSMKDLPNCAACFCGGLH